jgi:hypothetical protein
MSLTAIWAEGLTGRTSESIEHENGGEGNGNVDAGCGQDRPPRDFSSRDGENTLPVPGASEGGRSPSTPALASLRDASGSAQHDRGRSDHGAGGQECSPHAGGDGRDLWLYRDRTVALLKRYARMSVETGRLPSLLGRECFRARVTRYAMASFEDMAIFVHDVETALRRLNDFQQQMIALNVLEEYNLPEVARLLGCPLRTVEREISDTLDELSGVFLACGLMNEMGSD